MSTEDLEKALARGIEILNEFLPVKTYLYFPILYSACVWAVRRVFDYRERILAWQVWIDPDYIKTKPDEFILHFFATHGALSAAYEDEIDGRDMRVLRAAFPALYPVCGLEDAFLRGLFKAELDAADYRRIAAEFGERAAAARDAVTAAEADGDFWIELEAFGMEAAALGLHLLRDAEVQDMIVRLLKERMSGEPQAG
jgi:hypothetical protein